MLLSFSACGFNLIYVLGQTHIHNDDDDDDVESREGGSSHAAPDSPGGCNLSSSDTGDESTWENEEDAWDKSQDGALGLDVADVADDEGREDEEQWHHGERRGGPHHLCGEERKRSSAHQLIARVLQLSDTLCSICYALRGFSTGPMVESFCKMTSASTD